jgi:DNA polymerase III alpha subunit
MPDIDIDFADRTKALGVIKHIDAQIDAVKKHNTGVYCTAIPYNPITGISTIDYKEAEERGYFKLDFLNVSVYEGVNSMQHLKTLLNKEPIWDLLEQDDFTNLLFHVNGHGHVMRKMKPKNIEELAACLAIIRPAKKHLLGKAWDEVYKEVWTKPTTDEYYFKKAHAVAYAHVIVVQMNLICEQLANLTD